MVPVAAASRRAARGEAFRETPLRDRLSPVTASRPGQPATLHEAAARPEAGPVHEPPPARRPWCRSARGLAALLLQPGPTQTDRLRLGAPSSGVAFELVQAGPSIRLARRLIGPVGAAVRARPSQPAKSPGGAATVAASSRRLLVGGRTEYPSAAGCRAPAPPRPQLLPLRRRCAPVGQFWSGWLGAEACGAEVWIACGSPRTGSCLSTWMIPQPERQP